MATSERSLFREPPVANLHVGDARTLGLPDRSVDAIVTSVPFWQVRGYEDGEGVYDGQIGNERTVDEWLVEMWGVLAELARVLKRTGSIFLHIQDKQNSDKGGRNDKGAGSGVFVEDAPYKSLLFIPQRLAEGCIDPEYAQWRMTRAGAPAEVIDRVLAAFPLILREEIIIWRYNAMPESVRDRCRRQHEYLLHFTVHENYFADLDTIRTPQVHQNHAQLGKRHSGERWSSDDLATGTRRWAVQERKLDPRGAAPVSVWEIATEPIRLPPGLVYDDSQGGVVRVGPIEGATTRPVKVHTAVYPPHLVEKCISGWTPTGWTEDGTPLTAEEAATHKGPLTRSLVLDPFSGTGTTSLVAKTLGRDSVGYDLSKDYTQLARWRVTQPDQVKRILDRQNAAAQGALF